MIRVGIAAESARDLPNLIVLTERVLDGAAPLSSFIEDLERQLLPLLHAAR